MVAEFWLYLVFNRQMSLFSICMNVLSKKKAERRMCGRKWGPGRETISPTTSYESLRLNDDLGPEKTKQFSGNWKPITNSKFRDAYSNNKWEFRKNSMNCRDGSINRVRSNRIVLWMSDSRWKKKNKESASWEVICFTRLTSFYSPKVIWYEPK